MAELSMIHHWPADGVGSARGMTVSTMMWWLDQTNRMAAERREAQKKMPKR